MRTDIDNRGRAALVLFGLMFLLPGLFVVALGLGWIPINPAKWHMHGPGWVGALIGLPFVAFGIGIASLAWSPNLRLMAIMGGVMFVGVTIVIHWIAFGAGPREFTHQLVKNGVVMESGPLDEQSGRQIAGGCAIMLDLIFLAWVAYLMSQRTRRHP